MWSEKLGAMRTRRTLVALCLFGIGLAGCESLGGGRRVSHADLVNDLADRMEHSRALTYTADYQLPGGGVAAVMQDGPPIRWAYVHPGGKLTLTPEMVMECRRSTSALVCTLTNPPSPSSGPDTGWLAAVRATGLIPTSAVLDLLSATALDSDATVSQHDSTIAGQHATCVEVTHVDNAAAAAYDVCVTTDGVLGSFSGMVNGSSVEVTLTGYRDAVPADAFAVPSDATVVDQRGSRP